MTTRFTLIALAMAAWSAAGSFAQTTTTTSSRSLSYPPVGLASSETAQLNVVNTAAPSSTGTAASCTGSISFFNAAGTPIGTATTFTVGTGQIFSGTLPFTRVGATGLRTEVRGVVTLTVTSGSTVPCSLVTSYETYDTASGSTHVHLEGGGLEGYQNGGRH